MRTQYNAGRDFASGIWMHMADNNKPHWAWPHVVGVAIAIAVYFLIFRFTGDSDFYIVLVAALSGVGGMAATWAYIRFLAFPRG